MTAFPIFKPGSIFDILPSGYYLRNANNASFGTNAGATTASVSTGFERMAPFVITKAVAVDRIGAEITGAGSAGSIVRLGIRNALANGLPGTLLVEGGTIDGTSATYQEKTIAATLAPGIYWGIVRVEVNSCTMRVTPTGGSPIIHLPAFVGTATPAQDQIAGYRDAGGGSGAFGSSAPTLAAMLGSAPVVCLRIV